MKTYTTTQGDMWDSISYKIWGIEYLVPNLIMVNPEHIDTAVFGGGIVLNIPEITEPVLRHGVPPWRR